MPFELIITSLIGLFSGVISLYADPKDKKHKIWQFILLALIIVSACSTVYFGYRKEQESKATEAKKDSQINNLSDNLSQVNKQNSELLQTVNIMQSKLDVTGSDTKFIRNILEKLGWSQENINNPNKGQIGQSLQASQSLNKISGNADQRRGITVQYFPKNVDPNIVKSRLEALGVKLNTSASQLPGVPTNAIWFGSGVDMNTVKAVAYTLIGAGVELKMIRQFNNSQGREYLIQVGGDGECINRPTLTVERIRAIQEFPKQSEVKGCRADF
ncbi:MAG: hypothetical protein EWV50_21940 [Microcystis aeruginosa Ma_MB_F_20061100_S20]|uniref:Uncharacterized protein n=1 Tax=Microcystis aeruginosa Ma_MB_F_20061100_S20D TaxID=2486253 RepID=A0A552EVV1_MICAE|nr:MAG: hypothetical protein EWV50_21940 [Microcystis aeruginosa Ma_MB_F_20061100_S20]TRU38601.1 MAG: hypothetical protein EWV78_04810 [Microcystis aeruginosa Ma_MB_F_20061100_S20D]